MQPLRAVRKHIPGHAIEGEIDRVTALIAAHSLVEEIILFGSAADGSFTDHSDLDLLLIVPSAEALRTSRERLKPWRREISRVYPVDIVWFTRAEFERKRHLGGLAMIVNEVGRSVFRRETHD